MTDRNCDHTERVAQASPGGESYGRTDGLTENFSLPTSTSEAYVPRTSKQPGSVSEGKHGGAPRLPGIPEPARAQLLAALDASVRSHRNVCPEPETDLTTRPIEESS